MTAIVLKKEINFGAILISWLAKWIDDTKEKIATSKSTIKMFYGRFIKYHSEEETQEQNQG